VVPISLRMGGMTRRTACAGLAIALALIAGLGWYIAHTQDEARTTVRGAFERRAALTGKLIGGALTATTPAQASARYGGSESHLRRALGQEPGDQGRRTVVFDADGRVLAATRPRLVGDRRLARESAHIASALRGATALSDAFRDGDGQWVIEVAMPFATPSGRRVVAASAPVAGVRQCAENFFATASALRGSEGFLLDGRGRTLSTTVAPGAVMPPPDTRLTRALERQAQGHYGDRTFVSARVPPSHWRVVLSAPSRELYASVNGAARVVAWLMFSAFSLAVCALLALALTAVRGARQITELREREKAAIEREAVARQLAHERLHDALTGLPNRSLFSDRAEHAIRAAHRRGRAVAVVFMDLDHFKRINDSLGHAAGDAVLREVAERLRVCVRTVDTVSRFGGDEFTLLCEDLGHNEILGVVARVQHELSQPVLIGDRSVPVSFSVGVAVHQPSDRPRSAADLIQDADTAMYRAKECGRARIEVFDPELHQDAIARLDAEVALRRAVDEGELVVHYQPIVGLPDGAVRGVEALVRWQRGDTGELVPPAEFIPLAEETGLVADLGDWVLREAVREVGEWHRRGLIDDAFELSVNVSARQLGDPGLLESIERALDGWDLSPAALCLEITETAVMADPATSHEMLESLHAIGVRLALDDFGVGHSSLGQLARSLPISVLKLDRSFVAGMSGPRDRGIVEAAASLARALQLSSVAEGVETPEQAAELAGIGFPLAQGFHFGRPVDAEQMTAKLACAARSAGAGPPTG
jgi:diguanylate cyclase (GGDEF)-like protein